jgi:LCP family protein required for cell wall assembly
MTQTSADAGRDLPGRRPWRLRRRTRIGLAAAAVVLGLLAADVAVLQARVERVDVALPEAEGTTWVLLGTDSRAALPQGAPRAAFGTVDEVPGSRADVIVVVHEHRGGTTVLSVPRDLVATVDVMPTRLAVTWRDGPQATVDALCALGIPTDHLAAVDLAGFAAVVDAAGGIEVEVPEPVRDPVAGLEIVRPGRQQVDGRTALALVRSRHPEHLVDGVWTPAPPDHEGRAAAAGTVLAALARAARDSAARPWRTQALAWAATDALTLDGGTSVADLAGLALTDLSQVQVLPVEVADQEGYRRRATEETAEALAAAGLSCDP